MSCIYLEKKQMKGIVDKIFYDCAVVDCAVWCLLLPYQTLKRQSSSSASVSRRWGVPLQWFYSDAFNFNVNSRRWACDAIQTLFYTPYNVLRYSTQHNGQLQCLISHVRHSISIIRLLLYAQNVFHSPNAMTVRCTIEITTIEITITRTPALTIAT